MIALALPLLVLSGPVVPVGTFDDYRFTAEHQYGYGVRLWRQGDTLYGTFAASDGLAGDTPTGLIRNGRYGAGRDVSFTAELVTGTHSCKVHPKGVPARKAYTFRGRITGDRLRGAVEAADTLHPEIAPKRTPVVLEHRAGESALGSYETKEEWEAAARKTWAIVEGNGGHP